MAEVVPFRQPWSIKPGLKIAVVGFASTSRNQAPFQDPAWEVWGLNSLYALIPRFSRWFEIHPREYIMQDLQRAELAAAGIDHYTWLTEQPGPDGKCSVKDKDGKACACQTDETKLHEFKPIYMQEHYPQIPASVRWPREEINAWTVERFGGSSEIDYFTSTPGEMVAHAVFLGAEEIGLYGVDLLQDEEYAYQRPGCEYWLGVARGLGIKVTVPKASVLLKANYVYGYTEPPTDAKAAAPLVAFWQAQSAKLEQEQHRVASIVNTVQGCRQAFTFALEKLRDMLPTPPPPAAAGEPTVEVVLSAEQVPIAALVKEVEAKMVDLENRFQMGMKSLEKMGGQRELAGSGAAWTAAWGRGDKLEGMA